jgi:hypothetical protein
VYLCETSANTQKPWLNTTKISRYNSSQIIWSVIHSKHTQSPYTQTHTKAYLYNYIITINMYKYISYVPPSEMRIHYVIFAWCFRTVELNSAYIYICYIVNTGM